MDGRDQLDGQTIELQLRFPNGDTASGKIDADNPADREGLRRAVLDLNQPGVDALEMTDEA